MTARLLFVFSKEPQPGTVKTRMCPPLNEEQAARCHTAFLRDLLARLKKKGLNAHVVLAATPDKPPVLAALAAEHGIELGRQGPGDLGMRISSVFARARRERADAVVVGSDSPDLPLEYVNEAFDTIVPGLLVLGPSEDGGFYLAACNPATAFSWDGIPWGTKNVLERTIERADDARVAVRLLPWWYDVDDAAGLRRLALRLRVLRRLGEATALPASMRIIDELCGEGIDI